MREHHRCCRISSHTFESSSRLSASLRQTFQIAGSKPHYAPDLKVKVEHLKLEAFVDPKAKILRGTTTQRLRILAPELEVLSLDQEDMKIEAAWVGGMTAEFRAEGAKLHLRLPSALSKPKPGTTLEISVQYEVKHPTRRGIYFTGPEAAYPSKPYQTWTQSQDEDTHYWIPTFDYPNQKATTEMIATVPKGFTAISNGALVSKTEVDAGTRFHYRLGMPQVTYLITLVVAELTEHSEAGPGGVPVQYFVPPGREIEGQFAFGNTPKMIEAFARKTGVNYPYEKYSQVAVQDFIFGGMENTSATTQTDRTLHDARAHLDTPSDPLVSHELAHQWFGDLVTCRDWSHGWLNEGFATFMERVWVENDLERFGTAEQAREEGKYYSHLDFKEYFEEDSNRYRRPIVSNRYIEPIDLFDCHLYQKGGLVLNLLRSQLGEEAFWQSVRTYLERHRGGSVETVDLIRAIEDTTGRNLRRFFDDWVFSAGHPELEVSYQWHADKKLIELVIEQKQTDGQPEKIENGAVTRLFHLSIPFELAMRDGTVVRHTLECSEARERIFLPAPAEPIRVRLDPGNAIPKTLKFPRPVELLIEQLHRDPDGMGRIEAAHELVQIGSPIAVEALEQALFADRFWAVQAEVALCLAKLRTIRARDALIRATSLPHPKARLGVVKALGEFKDEVAAGALRPLAEKDASYSVEAEAIFAWTHTHTHPLALEAKAGDFAQVEAFLISQLSKESHMEVIRNATFRALAVLPGIGRGERPQALAAIIHWAQPGKPEEARGGAVTALGQIARTATVSERARILEVLAAVAEEDRFRLRLRLISALAEIGGHDAIVILRRIESLDSDNRVRRPARVVADALTAAGASGEALGTLRQTLEKMEEEQRRLKAALEEIRAASAPKH